jgi:GGDEF domain-containing protein
VKRLVTLAAAICEAIRDQSTVFGRLSARDLLLILSGKTVAEGTTVDELQALLDTLANPLLAVLNGSKIDGYRVTTSAEVAQRRIEIVAQQLSA